MKFERLLVSAIVLVSVALGMTGDRVAAAGRTASSPQPAGTPDPLDTPVVPESPTQIDLGRNAYYYHCMPCHGDRGQGLTDEWRAVWVHDHQNCWYRGCHSGRFQEEGFFIPRTIPAVMGTANQLSQFKTASGLFAYLQENHPPQRPGALEESEYWALTAFVLDGNGRTPSGDLPEAAGAPPGAGAIAAVVGGVLAALLLILGLARLVEGKPAEPPSPGE